MQNIVLVTKLTGILPLGKEGPFVLMRTHAKIGVSSRTVNETARPGGEPMQSPREIGRTCMTRLDGKVVLITGAARGLGAAAARVAIQRGAKVMLVDTRDELGTQLAAELGDAAAYVHSDVREESDWANAVSVA